MQDRLVFHRLEVLMWTTVKNYGRMQRQTQPPRILSYSLPTCMGPMIETAETAKPSKIHWGVKIFQLWWTLSASVEQCVFLLSCLYVLLFSGSLCIALPLTTSIRTFATLSGLSIGSTKFLQLVGCCHIRLRMSSLVFNEIGKEDDTMPGREHINWCWHDNSAGEYRSASPPSVTFTTQFAHSALLVFNIPRDQEGPHQFQNIYDQVD